MTEIEKQLYNLSNCRVRMSCPKRYKESIVGVLREFWIDTLAEDRINFNFKTDKCEFNHGFDKPHKFEECGNSLIFYTENVEYIFEIIN